MLRTHRLLPAFVLSLAIAPVVQAAITVDGTLDAGYGAYKQIQTNNTSFGNNIDPSGASASGSELDASYGVVDNGFLHLFIAGNLETNFNHYNIFIADGRAGQSTVNAATTGSNVHNMNGSKFSPGFQGTYMLDVNGSTTNMFVSKFDMTQAIAPGAFLGSFAPNVATPATLGGISFSLNNTNVGGVLGGAPSAPVAPDTGDTVTTGMEIAIPLSQLGTPSDSDIKVLISLNGGGNGFLSNQFLPGLPTVVNHVGEAGNPYQGTGSAKFDFSTNPLTTNQFFTVHAPAIASISTWASTGGGSWGSSTNWNPTIVPNTAGSTAIFGTSITGDSTVTLNGSKTVGRLTFNNSFKYTLAAGTPAGILTIDDTGNALGVDPLISVLAGSHEIAANVSLVNDATVNTLDNTTLTISGSVTDLGSLGIRKTGGGVLVLSNNANSIPGGIVSEGGTLQLNSNGAGGGGVVTLGDPDLEADIPATLALGTAGMSLSQDIVTNRALSGRSDLRVISAPAGNSTIGGQVVLNGGVVFSAAAGGTITVNGLISNGTDGHTSARHDIRVGGAGYVILTQAEAATGDTYVDGGTLVVNAGASLSGGSLNVFTNGVADIKRLDGLASNTKIYAQGKVLLPGNTTGAPVTVNVATLGVDGGGLIKVAASAATANPVIVNALGVEFLGDFTGKLDLTNNQLITTNDQNTVRLQLQAANIITSSANGTLGYKDGGGGSTKIQFAVAGDANLDGKVNTVDFNDLAGNFGTGTTWTTGDFNYDGVIDSLDLNVMIGSFGKTLPVASPTLGSVVPEPASLSLLAAAIPFLGRRRNRAV